MIDEARPTSPRGSSEPSSVGRRRAAPHWRPLLKAVDEAANDPTAPYHRHGDFEIEDVLGCGGMGIVLLARDLRLDRHVALKLWNLEGQDAAAALLHEAKCQARVTNPNVVTIYETGTIDGDVYLAMEYVDGLDARRWVNARRRRWQQVLALFVHAGRGLAAIHARDLVHADFKPENVLVDDRAGRVLVADFGVARILDEHEGDGGAGGGGSSGRGTKVYMAPERLARTGTDARSDQFSFCVSLWECLYGVRPFAGESPEELLASMRAGAVRQGKPLRGAPERLRRVLLRGLALDPAERFGSVEEFVAALDAVPSARRGRRVWALVGLGLVGAAGLGAGSAIVWERDEAPPATEAPIDTPGAIPHAESGIRPSPPATLPKSAFDPAPLGPPSLEEILDEIEAGDLDDARADWALRHEANRVAGHNIEELALVVAQAFLDKSNELLDKSPPQALVAARYALQCASAVSIELDATADGAAMAEEISDTAAQLVARLKPIVKRYENQSKHSTVPSNLE